MYAEWICAPSIWAKKLWKPLPASQTSHPSISRKWNWFASVQVDTKRSNWSCSKSNLGNFRTHSHPQGDAGAKGEAQHGHSAAQDLGVLLEEFIGCLQEESMLQVRDTTALSGLLKLDHLKEAGSSVHPSQKRFSKSYPVPYRASIHSWAHKSSQWLSTFLELQYIFCIFKLGHIKTTLTQNIS